MTADAHRLIDTARGPQVDQIRRSVEAEVATAQRFDTPSTRHAQDLAYLLTLTTSLAEALDAATTRLTSAEQREGTRLESMRIILQAELDRAIEQVTEYSDRPRYDRWHGIQDGLRFALSLVMRAEEQVLVVTVSDGEASDGGEGTRS